MADVKDVHTTTNGQAIRNPRHIIKFCLKFGLSNYQIPFLKWNRGFRSFLSLCLLSVFQRKLDRAIRFGLFVCNRMEGRGIGGEEDITHTHTPQSRAQMHPFWVLSPPNVFLRGPAQWTENTPTCRNHCPKRKVR